MKKNKKVILISTLSGLALIVFCFSFLRKDMSMVQVDIMEANG